MLAMRDLRFDTSSFKDMYKSRKRETALTLLFSINLYSERFRAVGRASCLLVIEYGGLIISLFYMYPEIWIECSKSISPKSVQGGALSLSHRSPSKEAH